MTILSFPSLHVSNAQFWEDLEKSRRSDDSIHLMDIEVTAQEYFSTVRKELGQSGRSHKTLRVLKDLTGKFPSFHPTKENGEQCMNCTSQVCSSLLKIV